MVKFNLKFNCMRIIIFAAAATIQSPKKLKKFTICNISMRVGWVGG